MKFPKKLSLYHKIVLKRSIPFVVAIFLVAALWLLLKPQKSEVVASLTITDGGNTISFNSGFYTVDTLGNVYEKEGSVIQNTPDTIKSYSHLSYLSRAVAGTNIKGKNVIVNGDAVVLMEGVQQLANLTLNGGTVSQPQPDRSGNINAIQYSDQEWAIEFLTYLKVPAGATRKVTCPTDYYVDASDQMGNGCMVEYSETFDGSKTIDAIDDWVTMDRVWQSDPTTFNQLRYTIPAAPYIENTGGVERYYPLRIRFKNDNRDERTESMAVVLRDSLNNIISGSEVAMPLTNIYGPASNGLVDITYQGKVKFNYYLLDNYVATESNPEQGWIGYDFSNAYTTYSNDMVTFNTFFSGYGRNTSGLFDLIFDDNTNIAAYDATYASSPFAKGTSTVFSEEVQYSYLRSTKTINPNVEQGSRYQSLGLRLSISGSLELNGGSIDLTGKGLPGYDFEMRRGTDSNAVTLFGNKRGAGYQTTPNSGGLSTDLRPQSAAHAGVGGAGSTTTNPDTGENTNIYGDVLESNTPGSGGGASYNGATPPNIGGYGGGVVTISADTVEINSDSSYIDVSGTGGANIYSTHSNYFAGGSGGSISIGSRVLNIHNLTEKYILSKGGMYNHYLSSGGSGGYVKVLTEAFYIDGDVGGNDAQLLLVIDCSGGREAKTDFLGEDGIIHVEVDVPQQNVDIEQPKKTVSVPARGLSTGDADPLQKLYYGDNVNMKIEIGGVVDTSVRVRKPIDVVLTTDLSGSMNYCADPTKGEVDCPVGERRLDNLIEAIHQFLVTADSLNGTHGPLINVGLVTFGGFGVIPSNPSEYNPTSVQGSALYTNLSGESLMSSRADLLGTTNSIDSYVRGLVADGSTPTGSGLNRAINILRSTDSKAERKHLILVTDGDEKQHPCTFGPGMAPPPVPIDANQWSCPIPDPMSNLTSGYPLNSLRSGDDISLFTIGVGVSSAFESYLDYMSSEQPPYMDSDVTTFFKYNDFADGVGLASIFSEILEIIIQSGLGTGFTLQETLPEGVNINDYKIYRKGGTEIDIGSCNKPKDNQLICDIYSSDYYDDIPASENVFVVELNFNINNVMPDWVDIDMNSTCENDVEGNQLPVLGSVVTYNPSVPFVSQNSVPTPSICMNIIPNEVAGDVFDMGDYLNHYVFKGKNLSINSNDENEISWDVNAYSENSSSQMSKDDVIKYLERIKSMNNEAATTDTLNTPSNRWNLQNLAIDSAANSQRTLFPEGKVWRYEAGYHSYGNISYSGIGTVIFNDDLTITSRAKIQKISSSNDSLGLIVLGDLHLQEGSEIEANILCMGNVYFDGDNINIKGSILASDYSGMENKHGNKITYDYKIGEKWPPGFKYFNMPIPVSTKP